MIALRPDNISSFVKSGQAMSDSDRSALFDAGIEQIIEPDIKDPGGFSVRRVLPAESRRMVGPFIFFDHLGPAEFPPGEGIPLPE